MMIQVFMAFIGSLGFSILLHTKKEWLWLAAIGGAVTWCLYLVCANNMNSYFACNLVAAIGASLYGELMAAIFKTAPVIFRVPAMVPLIPGGSLYYTLSAALAKDNIAFAEKGLETVITAFAISVGIVAVNIVCEPFRKRA